jgi:hypothetical protein
VDLAALQELLLNPELITRDPMSPCGSN